jgi:exodeoxyribonuclease VII small subunit
MAKTKFKFEESIRKLETIVDELEKGEFSLEESLKKFEAGLKLGRECREFLDSAETKIRQLVEEKGGDLVEKDAPDEL